MNEFTVIPALDLKGGAVVHAMAGSRADYRPDREPVRRSRRPGRDRSRPARRHRLSRALYRRSRRHRGRRQSFRAGAAGSPTRFRAPTLWIDAGFSDVADCAFWLPLGATLVIGSESLAGVDDWREHSSRVRRGRRAVARFRRRAAGRAPTRCSTMPALWPQRVIAMDLEPRRHRSTVPTSDALASRWSAWRRAAPSLPPAACAMRAISKRSPHCGRMARCSPRRCIATPSPQNEIAALSRERRSRIKSVHTPNRQKPSFWSHRRIGPGPPDLPGCPRPGGSPFQPAANGWCAASFFAVTSEAFGSPLTARAMASLVAR